MTTTKHYKEKREIYCLLTSVKEERKKLGFALLTTERSFSF
jgi:hypothetical protein